MKKREVPSKKAYSTPTLRTITREQTALILLGHAWDGDKNAKELLNLSADALFPKAQAKDEKRSGKRERP
jgi:hypothetical protein